MTDQTPPDPEPTDPTPPPAPEVAPTPPVAAPTSTPPVAATPPAATWAPPAAAGAPAGARPTGITILAILAGVGGVLGLLAGFVVLFAGGATSSTAISVLGLATLAYAALLLAFSWGAWTMQPWAWALGVAGAAFGIVVAVLQIILGGSNIASEAFGIIIDGAIIYYLNQPTIKAVFGRA
jgi:uncharacterized membrane protein (DUF2068 family)